MAESDQTKQAAETDHVGIRQHARFSVRPAAPVLLAIDVGTTHLKAALFALDGALVALAQRSTPTSRHAGVTVYDSDLLWREAAGLVREVAAQAGGPIAAIGIASMAESGLLLDRRSGAALTPLLPWHDRRPTPQAAQVAAAADRRELFGRTGQASSFKSTLAKLLWLRSQAPLPRNAVWLATADLLAYHLTGRYATDPSLATRTGALRIHERMWDTDWLAAWELDPDLFPPLVPSGTPVGYVTADATAALGVAAGTPVAIAGHDHVCAAFAVGAVDPEQVLDSMGTAETLVGGLPARALGPAEYASGLGFGCHVLPDRLYWMGGLSASGGSVEWLRTVLGDPPLSYAALAALVEQAGPAPTGLLFLPYLLGSGAPHADALVRGAFVGLAAHHARPELAKAVLEGAALELELIAQAAEQSVGRAIRTVVAAGGGTRSHHWLQIKADVGGRRLVVPARSEATLLGAALLAGVGAGVYRDAAEALGRTAAPSAATYLPDPDRHRVYRQLYHEGYLPLQEPLRRVAARLATIGAA